MSSLGRVLIVDDEPALRQTLARILQQIGCEVNSAANGNEALSLLQHGSYDLVYLDIRLPGMDGLEVLSQIRLLHTDLPVILLTGHGSLQSAMQAVRLGASDYLLKPVDPAVMVARTRDTLRQASVEKRKLEIREQIAALQQELHALENESAAVESPAPGAGMRSRGGDRFMQRGSLVIDLQARRATLGAVMLSIPPASFDYLVVLARHSPEAVDYQTLVVEAQQYQVEGSEARQLAKYHIHVLRQALGDDFQNPHYLLTVRGVGYKLLLG